MITTLLTAVIKSAGSLASFQQLGPHLKDALVFGQDGVGETPSCCSVFVLQHWRCTLS